MQQLIEMLGMKFNYTRELLLVGLILARTLPMVFISPFMGGQQAPPETKMSIGVLFTILVWPLAHDSMTAALPITALPFLLLMLKETMVGFCIGFANAHIFYAMDTAGRFVDTARGAAMSEVLVPSSKQRATALGTLYSQLLLCVFMILGGHHIFIDTFFYSFSAIPLNEGIDGTPYLSRAALYAIEVTGEILQIAVILSAAPVCATLVTDMVFGILNRVAPQLNAYHMAMPVKAVGALILLLVSLTPFMDRLEVYIEGSLVAARTMVDMLKKG